jgi:uncharacterized protein (DUF1499 family)
MQHHRPKIHWLALAPLLMLTGCAALSEHSTGVIDGALTPCPPAPRCVSSQSDQADQADHAVAPLALTRPPDRAWAAITETVRQMPRTTIKTISDRYLHAEVVSPWRVYTDDLELLLRREAGRVEVRSSARLGYYDFEVNRERVEALRARLAEQGIVRPSTP